MNKVCLKSMLLGAGIVFVTMLVMGAAVVNTNVNGRYQVTSHIYNNMSRVFVVDTQTGEVRSIDMVGAFKPEGYYKHVGTDDTKVYTSGPWTK